MTQDYIQDELPFFFLDEEVAEDAEPPAVICKSEEPQVLKNRDQQ